VSRDPTTPSAQVETMRCRHAHRRDREARRVEHPLAVIGRQRGLREPNARAAKTVLRAAAKIC